MKFDLVKTGSVFKPAYPEDEDKTKKVGQGEVVKCETWNPRNVRFHRKFFALVKMAYDNQNKSINFDNYRKLLIMKAGYYEEVITDKGKFYIPDSISFKSMDDVTFSELYDKMVDVVIKEIKVSKEQVMDNLENFM